MSENKNHANQQNAKLSTGPKSQQGKIVIKTNALKHGLRAKQIIIFDESEEEFDALCKSLHESLKPKGSLQIELVNRISACLWRLRRIPNFEAGLLEYQLLQEQLADVETEMLNFKESSLGISPFEINTAGAPAKLKSRHAAILKKSGTGQAAYGKAYCRDIKSDDALGKLSRYESQISRELFRALDQLRRMQAESSLVEVKASSTE